ncbi:signal peptidase I, partial [archaeon]|nr:signal peptidase I [archaeon]
NITKDEAEQWILKNGFEMGDIIFLKKSEDITEGDIIVFEGNSKNPIIHRVVDTWEEDETDYYQTKGDNNKKSYPELGETRIHEDKVIGKSLFKVPKIGWIKIVFAKAFGGL